MQTAQPNLFLRDDTFLGVCEALGEDFGFDPLWLRVAFAVALIWNPVAVVAAYLAAGILIAFVRLVAPNPRFAAPAQAAEPKTPDAEREPMAKAA